MIDTADEARELIKATKFDPDQAVKSWLEGTQLTVTSVVLGAEGNIYFETQQGGKWMDENTLIAFANWLTQRYGSHVEILRHRRHATEDGNQKSGLRASDASEHHRD